MDARDKLKQAGSLVVAVRGVFLSAGYTSKALASLAMSLLADEIAALDKAIAGSVQP